MTCLLLDLYQSKGDNLSLTLTNDMCCCCVIVTERETTCPSPQQLYMCCLSTTTCVFLSPSTMTRMLLYLSHSKGDTLTLTLNKFETFHALQADADADFTGAYITSNKPISVVSGNKKVTVSDMMPYFESCCCSWCCCYDTIKRGDAAFVGVILLFLVLMS